MKARLLAGCVMNLAWTATGDEMNTMTRAMMALVLAAATMSAACGGDDDASNGDTAMEPAANSGTTTDPPPSTRQASCEEVCAVVERCGGEAPPPIPGFPPELIDLFGALDGADCEAACAEELTSSQRACIADGASCEASQACLDGGGPPPPRNDDPMPPANNPPSGGQVGTWAGTWFAEIEYTVTCSSAFRDPSTKTLSGSWSVRLEGSNDDLSATTSTNYVMTGSGNATSLNMSGTFPLLGVQEDRQASTANRDTRLSLRIDSVTSDGEVRGTMSGDFETSDFALNACKLDSASVKMTR